MPIRLVAAFLLLAAVPAAAKPISAEDLRGHVDMLASDSFEGREPGTAGEQKTIAYIARQMQGAGLEPAGPRNSWYQPLDVVVRRPGDQSSAWQARGKRGERIALDRDELILIGRSPRESLEAAPVVFAGHGAVIPARGIDQLRGGDIKGAIVLVRYDTPKGEGVPAYAERVRAAAARGAAAVIGIVGDELPWPVVQRIYDAGQKRLAVAPSAPIQGVLSAAGAERLVRAAGGDPARLIEAPAPGFEPLSLRLRGTIEVATAIETIATSNVVGRLRGSGGTGESLLYLAHWDHLGLCAPDERDRICNGAVDNASGIAALIEIGRALAAGPRPKRDILFLATTAEELGLLGAEYFAARPPVPLASIVAAINMDTLAIAPKGEKVAMMGRGRPAIDALVERSVAEAGRILDPDDEAAALVERQDGWALARAGVPAIMVGGSFSDMKKLGAFLAGPYHSAADNPGPGLVLDGAAEDAELMVALGRKLADPDQYPSPARP